MSAPLLSDVQRPEIGRFYMVPCIKVEPRAQVHWMDPSGWVPVIGPKHRDAEFLEFDWEHMHVDWRFVAEAKFRYLMRTRLSPLGTVVSNDGTDEYDRGIRRVPELRRLKCKREMPTFPDANRMQASRIKWARLERAQAIVCNKLKPGNICPHRGIDLTAFAQEDGTAICPGHGLRWNLKTGELMPRFAPGRVA